MSTPPSTPPPTRTDLTMPPGAPSRGPGQGFGLVPGQPGARAAREDIFAALPPLVTPDRGNPEPDPLQQPDPPERDGAKRQLDFDPEEDEEGPKSKRNKTGGKRRKSKKRKSKRRKNKKSRRNKRR